jgi:hypothetical protein
MSQQVRNIERPTEVYVPPAMRHHVQGKEQIEDLLVVHTHSDRDTGYHYGIVATETAIYTVSQLVGSEWHLGAVPILADPRHLVRLAVVMLRQSQERKDRPLDLAVVESWLQAHGQRCNPIVVRRTLTALQVSMSAMG